MIISIRKILFPTDFSKPAAEAQQYSMALADRFGAELHLLHVVVPPVVPYPDAATSWTMPDIGMKSQVQEAERSLAEIIGSWGQQQRRMLSTVKIGFAVEEITKYAEEHAIDLIVVGTHGHRGIAHVLIGSVAEKLVRIAACPVLTVHPQGHQFVMNAAQDTYNLQT